MKRSMFLFLTILFTGLIILSACGSEEEQPEDENTDQQDDTEVIEEDDDITEEEEDVENENENDIETPTLDDEAEDTDQTDSNGDPEQNQSTHEEGTTEEDTDESDNVELENDTFRVFEPAENAVVGNEFTVQGEASVADGTVYYEFEDGHNILDQGNTSTSENAPDWGAFEFTVTFDEVAYDVGTLILYEELEDGTRTNQLYVPVSVE